MVAFLAMLTIPNAAWGNATQASSRITLFDEPSTSNAGVRVLHPQIDATAGLGSSFNINAGYNVDIVTGATPAVFGPRTGVDAVSGATKFSDTRHLVHGGMGFERPDGGIAFGYAYGWESDYKTSAISATTHHDLFDHNFTLGLSYTHNFDSVCDVNNAAAAATPLQLIALGSSADCFTGAPTVVSHRLHIDTIEPSLSWTMTPRLIIQGGGTAQLLDGFQSNPYRSVMLGQQNNRPQERHPRYRQRYAVFGRIVYALPELRASAFAMLRLYEDSWALRAITGDVVVNKYLGKSLLISGRARYHLQGGASFYRDVTGYRTLGPTGEYWTGDRELSPMGNYLLGGKVAYLRRPQQERSAWFVEMELNAKYEILLYKLPSEDAPNADRKFAHIVQGAFALRF
jgi:hypothetical protein